MLEPMTPAPGSADAARRHARANSVWRRFLASPRGIVALVLVTFFVVLALGAPVLAPYDPAATIGARNEPPSGTHPLGTDYIGRDLLSRAMWGAQASLAVGVLAGLIAITMGTVIGSLAGYFGGAIDNVLMRLTEFVQIMPGIVIAIVVAAIFDANLWVIILIIGLTTWTYEARIIRAQVLAIREQPFVAAARVSGFGHFRIVFREIFPNAFPPMIVQGAMSVGDAVMVEAALSFLGIGDLNQPSWGRMISTAQPYLEVAPLQSIVPGAMILLIVVTFTLLADALNDAFNPRAVNRVVNARRVYAAALKRAREARKAGVERNTSVAMANPANVLEAEGLSLSLRSGADVVQAVKGVSLSLGAGRIAGVVGESGSGKSTVARMIAGLSPSAEVVEQTGDIRIAGRHLSVMNAEELRLQRRGLVGMIFQEPLSYLNPTMRIGRQLEEGVDPALSPEQRARKIEELLGKVGLVPVDVFARRYPHELSGGQRQRALIAMALAMEPELLIADEPTTALDASVQAEILHLLFDLHEELGFGVVIISHDLEVIKAISDDVYVMLGGSVVESGRTEEVFGDPQHEYTRKLLASHPSEKVTAAAGLTPDALGLGDDEGAP